MYHASNPLRVVGWTAVAVLLFCAGLLRAETLEDVEKAVAAKYEAVTSVTYELEMEYGFEANKVKTTGTYELLHDGDKWKRRSDETWAPQNGDGPAGNTPAKRRITIEDGEYNYVLDEISGTPVAEKSYLETYGEKNIGARWFKRYRTDFNLALLPEETVDGHATYVVEAISKKNDWKFLFYTDKETGIMLKSICTSLSGNNWMCTVRVKNIQLNKPIPADHFVFTPPTDVKFNDKTKVLDDK